MSSSQTPHVDSKDANSLPSQPQAQLPAKTKKSSLVLLSTVKRKGLLDSLRRVFIQDFDQLGDKKELSSLLETFLAAQVGGNASLYSSMSASGLQSSLLEAVEESSHINLLTKLIANLLDTPKYQDMMFEGLHSELLDSNSKPTTTTSLIPRQTTVNKPSNIPIYRFPSPEEKVDTSLSVHSVSTKPSESENTIRKADSCSNFNEQIKPILSQIPSISTSASSITTTSEPLNTNIPKEIPNHESKSQFLPPFKKRKLGEDQTVSLNFDSNKLVEKILSNGNVDSFDDEKNEIKKVNSSKGSDNSQHISESKVTSDIAMSDKDNVFGKKEQKLENRNMETIPVKKPKVENYGDKIVKKIIQRSNSSLSKFKDGGERKNIADSDLNRSLPKKKIIERSGKDSEDSTKRDNETKLSMKNVAKNVDNDTNKVNSPDLISNKAISSTFSNSHQTKLKPKKHPELTEKTKSQETSMIEDSAIEIGKTVAAFLPIFIEDEDDETKTRETVYLVKIRKYDQKTK
ncbi:hypothetical protein HK096_002357, partial [Nowakowskiella sp. JEL0078]